MATTLHLAILDSGVPDYSLVFAQSDYGVAVARLPCGSELKSLAAFRQRIENALLEVGIDRRPTRSELADYGQKLFHFIFRDRVADLYNSLTSLPSVRLDIFSDHPDLQKLPWEYIQERGHPPGPRIERSVIRIVSSNPLQAPIPLSLKRRVRLLFVYSNPRDQDRVGWSEVKARIEQVFCSQIGVRIKDRFTLKTIEGRRGELVQTLQGERYDVFHFCGHGVIRNGVGHLIFLAEDNTSKYLRADDLAGILSGRGIRLAVLSACETSTGNFAAEFDVIAKTLVSAGIPAVVANQLPIPDSSIAAFVAPMYESLLKRGDIDEAVGEGRVSLAAIDLPPDDAPVEWGIPTLYRHIAAAQVFKP